MAVQVKKSIQGRTRFLVKPLADLNDWQSEYMLFKDAVEKHTLFQQVEDKVVLEVRSGRFALMLEAVGVPSKTDQFTFSVMDLEKRSVYTAPVESDLFETTFPEILTYAEKIKKALQKGQMVLDSPYHVVILNGKIELHFFLQNDYSQNLL